VWERERRVSWEDEARQAWLEERESDREELWEDIKEDMWSLEQGQLWRNEEEKLARKQGAFRSVIASVNWKMVLGEDRVSAVIGGLNLPGTDTVWKKMANMKKDGEAAVLGLGLVGLFRETLLDSVGFCPVSRTPYLIQTIDTTAVKQFAINCPIVDTARVKFALLIDSETSDTSQVEIRLPGSRKLFGGGTVVNHGNIDLEARRSWETRGR
jgi:hypothetical protein